MSHYPKGYLLRWAEANGLPNASRLGPRQRRLWFNENTGAELPGDMPVQQSCVAAREIVVIER